MNNQDPQHNPRRSKRPFWIMVRRAAIVLALVGGCELMAAALTSPRMEVQKVEVIGGEITSPDELKTITTALVGQNWIRAHVREAAETASRLPTVRTAHVVRVLSWPPSLQLQIEERQPFARVGGGDQWWVVDQEGMPFRRAGKDDATLYAVTAPTLQPEFGQPLRPEAWRPAVELASLLASSNPANSDIQDWSLRRIYFDKAGFASLRLAGGANDKLLVRLGSGRWPEKLQRAKQALAYFSETGRHAVALNLISYSRPTWTPRVETPTGETSKAEASTSDRTTMSPARQHQNSVRTRSTEDVTEDAEAGASASNGHDDNDGDQGTRLPEASQT